MSDYDIHGDDRMVMPIDDGASARALPGTRFNRSTTINSSLLRYPLAAQPAPGTLLPVADGVYWLRMPLPFALDHINLWLLRDGNGWAIVDTGFGTDVTKQLWERIFADHLGQRPVTRIIVTHLHPDHIGLAAWLAERFAVDVWMTQTEFLLAHAVWAAKSGDAFAGLVGLYAQHGLDEKSLAMVASRAGAYRSGVPSLPVTLRRLIDGDLVTIDDRPWRVIVGRGHSPEHASLYCAPLGVLISGDMVLPRITTNVSVAPFEPEGDPLGLFLASLKRFADLPPDTLVLPSHGLVFHGLHARLAQLAEHHEERFGIILQACAHPRSAAELLGHLFKRELDAHQLSFAMGEAIAHLNCLMHARRLHRMQDGGAYRFVRAA